jgi:uncharacterized membrane protein
MWFTYAIITALLSAISISFNKHLLKQINASTLTLAITLLNLPFLIIFNLVTYKTTALQPLFFAGILGSSTLFIASKTLSLSAMKNSQLSQVIPLSSLSVFATYIYSLIFLGENISTRGFAGLALITIGTYILNADQINASNKNLLAPITLLIKHRSPRIYIFAIIISSFISIFDKTSLTHMEPLNPSMQLLFHTFSFR